MMRSRRGLSLIELIIVVAIVGVLSAIGYSQLNFGGFATRQAAQVLASSVNRARFEAIRGNGTAGLEIVAAANGGSGLIRICGGVDPAIVLACSSGSVIDVIDLAQGDLARARILDSGSIFFDRRGVVRTPTAAVTIRVADRSGNNLRTVTIGATGRAAVQ